MSMSRVLDCTSAGEEPSTSGSLGNAMPRPVLCMFCCVCMFWMLACMSAGEEPSMSGGLGDPIIRLVLRLVLLYLQQAPVPRARDCVQQALFLLPNLLNAHDTLSRYHQLHASYTLSFSFLQVTSASVVLPLMPTAWRRLHAWFCLCCRL